MKLPRDISGNELVRALVRLGYRVDHQRGSHARLVHPGPPTHAITVPMHDPIKTGTLNSILKAVADHLKLTRDELLEKLFG